MSTPQGASGPDREIRDGRLRLRHVELFLGYLQELTLTAWIAAVRQRKHHRTYADAIDALGEALQALGDPELVFVTRNGVLAQLQRFAGVEGKASGLDRRWTNSIRSQTERAALAVLVRDKLSAEAFTSLYSPFEPLIPSTLLFGIVSKPRENQ